MLVESMYELALIERKQQLRNAARRQLLHEYRQERGGGFPASAMAALASIRAGFALRRLARLHRPA
jgi:hypothetical protein